MRKIFFFLAAFFMIATVQAKIYSSTFEEDHQKLIELNIEKACKIYPHFLEQLDSTEAVVRVDQGIFDVYFTTHLHMREKVDQGVFNDFDVIVKSALFDQYDHRNKRWGAYVVLSAECSPRL